MLSLVVLFLYVLNGSVTSDSWWPHGPQPTRLFCPQNFPGKNTGVGCYSLFQGIFLTQRQNSCLFCLLHWQVDCLLLKLPGKPMGLFFLPPSEFWQQSFNDFFFQFLAHLYFLVVSFKIHLSQASGVAQWERIHLPVQETWIQSLIREDPTRYWSNY